VDWQQLTQVLVNLVRNGLECLSSARDGKRRLAIRTRRSVDTVRIEVVDTGPGIPQDLLSALFEPFISRKAGGTGLGLAVVRKIMLDHGGDVLAENLPEGGARFTLTLPLTAVSPPHLEVEDRERAMDSENLSR
jgi:signal transduction histidine kinase